MALRSGRDVQKASYYVWFLGAEEAKGLRGPRVINPVLPYLIDRSRCHEPLKVTLQVSHKGIKIVQGSSKHLIPHSAITSSVQTDDIVACVLLLYNPATRCPLHVHAYRCDSESTAEALHMQLQVLINRPDNQKRFEELESRLGILPPLSSSPSSSSAGHGHNDKSTHSVPTPTTHGKLSSPTSSSVHNNQTQYQPHHQHAHNESHRTHEAAPKSFNSSLGSDTSSELFDSLAAELRAKLNGNGPPLLLPPRDYDTVHRSKGNLTAIELRRCRNALIVGGAAPTTREHEVGVGAHTTITAAANVNSKQISSRGSSGIGSDLAPSPERQDLNSSSDDEHCLNETDNSVIGPKPSQIAMARATQRSAPIISHQVRKSAMQPPEDSYLRDLPVKPYMPRQNEREREREPYVRALSDRTRSRDDNIVPVIIRPVDYDQNFNRDMHTEKKHDYPMPVQRQTKPMEGPSPLDMDKCNEINQFLNKKLLRDKEHNITPDQYQHHSYNNSNNNKSSKHSNNDYDCPDDFDEPYNAAAAAGDQLSAIYRKENLPDKMKFKESSSKKRQQQQQQQQQQKSKEPVAPPPLQRYGVNGRHRYVDPADLPFEQPGSAGHNRYAAIHRSVDLHSPDQADLSHRKAERHERPERHGGHERTAAADLGPPPIVPHRSLSLETERKHEPYAHSKERNPYREAESLPYIQSMEKMMKSSAMRYKSYDRLDDGQQQQQQRDEQRSNTGTGAGNGNTRNQLSGHHPNEASPAPYHRTESSEYLRESSRNVTQHERFRDAKDKFRAMERPVSRYDMADERDRGSDYKPRHQHQQHQQQQQQQQSRRHRQNVYEPTANESSARSDSGHLHSSKEQKHSSMMLQQQSSLERRNHNCRSMCQDWSDDYDDDDDNDVDHSNDDVIGVERHIALCNMDSCKEPTSSGTSMNRSRTRSRDIWEESSGSGICQEPPSRRDLRDVRDMPDYTRYDVRPPSSLHSTSQLDVLPRESSRDRYCNEPTPQHQNYERSVSRSRHRERDHSHEFIARGDYTPTIEAVRTKEKSSSASAAAAAQRVHYNERGRSNNGSPTPKIPQRSGNSSQQHLANMPKGYRHSYAEPVFARSGGRVGLAAVNPY